MIGDAPGCSLAFAGAGALWVVFAFAARRLLDNPRGDVGGGLAMLFMVPYARLMHRLRVVGRENVPDSRHPGPLVVVCNHTAGIDPLLVQSAIPFEVKWMMARDMQPAWLNWLWEFAGVIPVNRLGPDSAAARAAIRHLQEGGVIGVFPEGGISRPSRRVLPFQGGVGLLVHKPKARVLQIIIDGAPDVESAWASLVVPSRAVLRFLPMRDYSGMSASAIAADLRQRLLEETGWPSNDHPDRRLTQA